MEKQTICLSMIVKNEQHCIARCLNSVKKYIDYYIICDTGSTDNTVEIIKETMGDVPGEILFHEWQDFSTNRNLGLDIAKTKADFVLIIDADDALVVEDDCVFSNLDKDAYTIKIKHGILEYYRPQLMKSSIDFKYKDVIHEYIESNNCAYSTLDGAYIQTSFNGSRSQNPNKYLDDCKIIEDAILKNPSNSRYVFYLAQSYRDGGDDKKALQNYNKRSLMGGYAEEVFVSLHEIAKIKERLGFSMYDVECAYLLASYNNIKRAEPLYNLSRFFRLNGNFNKAYCYAKEALKRGKPDSGLFIEEDCYRWKILDELSISAYYEGHFEEGKAACEQLMRLVLDTSLTLEQKGRISVNYGFYCVVLPINPEQYI